MSIDLSIDLEESEVANIVAQYHRYIDRLLLLQQQALVARETELALGFMQLHRQMLSAHIEVEDQWLLSIATEQQQAWRWPASLYLAEHKKITRFLTREEQRLQSLAQRPTATQVIALLDSQRSYKNLLEHHEEREEIALLKEISPLQQQQLQQRVSERWRQLYQQQRQPLAELAQRLATVETDIMTR
ncbi:hypothetical protein SIN8267_01496 [Sinobacterium norvegicum]|uniref:Hemerythrin-like domain-containing protein n=1 Tax=Sinobacterium norvegicum TaxID=1641715 RepID=A0ABN8EJ53_9GAMM|nr:hypothetical protein [Sinobacterium norvegicum]CAH0991392.1 hypothetical protein SIN8267_01496 [Sinobacterium norvegicum]